MNKVEPADIDNEYNDIDAAMSEPMHDKDECSDENGNFDDIDRDSADTKMHLGGLNEIKTDINDNDETADGKSNVYGGRKRDGNEERCLESHDTNLLSRNGGTVEQSDSNKLSELKFLLSRKSFLLLLYLYSSFLWMFGFFVVVCSMGYSNVIVPYEYVNFAYTQ